MINKTKQNLKQGKTSIGSWITLAHTAIAEIMAKSGFEWLAIDMEHSAIGIQDMEPLIQVIEASGSVPLVRLWGNDPVLAKKAMDAGAYGVIVPMVNSRQDAEKAVNSIKYPPDGQRGVGLYRAQGYGPGFSEYVETANEQSLVVVQIEHIDGVNNIQDILNVEGIDGVFIGPYDLSGSLGLPGDLKHPKVEEACNRVLDAVRDKKIAAGIHVVQPSIDDLKRGLDQGYQFIAFGTDFLFLGNSCRDSMREITKLLADTEEPVS